MKPGCFENEQQYKDWLRLFNVSGVKIPNVCLDCTPAFAAKMREDCRCDNPGFKVPNPYAQTDDIPVKPIVIVKKPSKPRAPKQHITEEIAIEVRRRLKASPRYQKGLVKAISESMGVSIHIIYHIAKDRCWADA